MEAAREPDQADFDLERFINMFDEALTSRDERVVNALRSLMMMTILTKSETYGSPARDRQSGPLRKMYEDLHHINRRLSRVEEELRDSSFAHRNVQAGGLYEEKDKYARVVAKQMAQSIDDDIVRKLSAQTAMSINGGQIKGLK